MAPFVERVLPFSPKYVIRLRHPETSLSPSSRKRAVLMLHGFPATRFIKNLDVAFGIADKAGLDTYLLHYSGLGESPGPFGFTKSVMESIEIAREILGLENYEKLSLVGNSWGGVVALNLAATLPERIDRVLLLAPFCQVERNSLLYQWMADEIKRELPGLFGGLKDADVHADLENILQNHIPEKVIDRLSPALKIKVIQSPADEITPLDTFKALLPRFRNPVELIEWEGDHSLQIRREEIIRLAASFSKV